MSARIENILRALIDDLRETHGQNLIAVVLYGSAAVGDHIPQQSDYNLLVVLRRITLDDLRLAQGPVRNWQRLGYSPPVYFTLDELREAADVFPIEFHHMEDARRVLYGVDPFEGVTISDENLRHQTEYELRGKLLQLRRRYISDANSPERLRALMIESLPGVIALLAPALMLSGERKPPVAKRDLIALAAERLALDRAVFDALLALRERGADGLDRAEVEQLFAAYLAQIERLIDFTDRLDGSTHGG